MLIAPYDQNYLFVKNFELNQEAYNGKYTGYVTPNKIFKIHFLKFNPVEFFNGFSYLYGINNFIY